ncbi:uncharacterized protein C12orf40 homolog [Cricetulus griseus]|uniref:Uncharacterized protein C12orf40 homolog n=1 Tax=Cricetulus griseus TaxID=10029 RepID=A0A061IJR8_CRIGR|nr:uncharacterized protein C12orf40 homolog [Cricetulus griseus]XP_035296724.1 uncharacterized protein C12orf40 homolog [Cricetulus griseus]ERE84816.1 hypothetical protein H671_2g5678 [Cricetulus griseus]
MSISGEVESEHSTVQLRLSGLPVNTTTATSAPKIQRTSRWGSQKNGKARGPENWWTRVLIKQERRKQKEYFEKNKLKSKMKLLEVFSPVKNPTVSLDLLNLYMVNQISSKKTPETTKRPTHVNMNRDLKIPLRKHDLELPMSPHCVPSKLCIDDMEKNVPYQRFCSKEETGPVQSSQDMNSYRMFNKTENCSYIPPSFPAELPSNRYIPNQNSTPGIELNPRKFTSEKNQNEQFSNGTFSDSLFSKLNNHQDIFSSPQKTAEFGASYERVASPETGNFLTKRPVILGEDYGSPCERRQPDFAMEKTSVQQIWGSNGKAFSDFLEDVIQPTQRNLSSNHDSDVFVSHNMINLLSRDQPGRMATFHKCGYGSVSDTCVFPYDESHSTGGFIKGNFPGPQAAFHNHPLNTSYLGTCQPKKPPYQEYSNREVREFRRSFETDCHPTSRGRKGKTESDDQEEALQRNTWEYPVYSMGDIPLKELHHKQSCDFDRNEIPMEGRGMCPLKGRSMSTEKIYLESSQSSQSASYSPRPTESTFSSSSDLISEDEDQMQQQTEESIKKATETTDTFCLERVEEHLGDIMVKDNVKIHKQKDNFPQSSVKNTDTFPVSQYNSGHISQNKTSNDCVLQAGRCDLGVQTENELLMGTTADVAIQCTIISQCSCKRSPDVPVTEVPSLHKAASCSDAITAHTTGGQETLADNSL